MNSMFESRRAAGLYTLPPIFALGAALLAWSVTGALHQGGPVRAALALAVLLGLIVAWLVESGLLAKALKVPFYVSVRKIALSWLPFIILPMAAPYFSGRVYSSFLSGDPSNGRVLVLTAWLLALAAGGSIILKFILFRGEQGRLVAIAEKHALKILWCGTAVYFILFAALVVLAYRRYTGYNSDLGEYNQALWSTLRGNLFHTTLEETSNNNYLGTHISPFLLMLLPFYALRQSPLTYLLMRTLALSLAAVPLFYCVRWMTKSSLAALLLAGAFLFHPEIVSQNFTSGYEVVFGAAFFFAAFYFFLRQRFGWFIFFLVMVMAVREDFVPVALVFAVYSLIKRRPRIWILTPLALFAVWEVAVSLIFSSVITHFTFNLYYGHFGASPAELVKTVITHPVFAAQEVWRYHRSYLYNLLVPEGMVLPFTSAASLFALPNLILTLARGQDLSAAAGGISHYSVLVVSAFWMAIAGFTSRVQKWFRAGGDAAAGKAATILAVLILVFVGASVHLWSYYLPTAKPADANALSHALAMIPAEASVSSNDGRALARLSSRWEVYEPLLWDVPQPPDYLPQGRDQLQGVDFVLLKPFNNSYYNEAGAFSFVTEPGSNYRLIFQDSDIKLYQSI